MALPGSALPPALELQGLVYMSSVNMSAEDWKSGPCASQKTLIAARRDIVQGFVASSLAQRRNVLRVPSHLVAELDIKVSTHTSFLTDQDPSPEGPSPWGVSHSQ